MLNGSLFEAKASSPRKILVENFASSLLPNAPTSNAAFRAIYLNDKDIIPLYYSINLYEGDDINNAEELTYQRYGQFYPMDQPVQNAKFVVNGEICYLPALQATINKFKNKTSPFTMYAIETVTDYNLLGTVVIETDVDIPSSAQLFFAAVEKSVYLANAQNGEHDYYNVARLFRGSPLVGINISEMKAGDRMGFNEVFPYNPVWKKENMYLVAFIQDFGKDKEVLQSTFTYDNSKEKPTIATNVPEIEYTNDNFTEVQYLELINSSLANIQIESISFDGPGKDAFKVGWDPLSMRLFAANRKQVSFEFKPAEEGVYEAVLTVVSNATNKPTIKIPVKGTLNGIVPLPEITYNFNTLDFGEVETFKELEVNIVNSGNVNLVIDSIYVPEPENKVFKIISEIPKSIAPNRSSKVRVRFEPAKNDSYYGELLILSNAVNEPEASIGLNGSGKSVKPYANLVVSKDTLDFGTTSSVVNTNFSFKNEGNKVLTLKSFSLQNVEDETFKLSENPKKSINPNEEITVTVSFIPKDNKGYQATLFIQSDANNTPLKFITLKGTGEGIIIGSVKDDISDKIKLYPNPAVNLISLDLPIEINVSEVNSIQMMDLNGKELAKFNQSDIQTSGNTISLNVKDLKAGVYILRINTSNDYYFSKFIIQ